MFVSLSQVAIPNKSKASQYSENFKFALLLLVTHRGFTMVGVF